MAKSQQNKEEGDAIVFLIKRLMAKNRSLSIGVIAPYKSQIKYLDGLIRDLNYGKESVKVSTVDAFQGQERDVIIMTCVRSNLKGEIGFVRCEKRMNVSITRAKYALFVFGSQQTLRDFNCHNGEHYWQNYLDRHQQQ